ncbi:MAG: hypothetical protein VKL42_01110 [Snowella sp.]|nr:hypothetical protein [Snowella sp.]
MSSLVQELQRDALNSSVSTLELLRKALVVATKLNIPEFEEWIEFELSGYSNSQNIPSYRYIEGSVKGCNSYGCRPVSGSKETMSKFSKITINQSIAEVECLISSSKIDQVNFEFPPQKQDSLRQSFEGDTIYLLESHISEVTKISESVRNIILRWSLRLEKDGILGEGITFSIQEKAIASQKDYNVSIYNIVYNTTGDMKMGDDHSINVRAKGDVAFNGALVSGDTGGNVNPQINNISISESQEFLQLIEKLKLLKELFEQETGIEADDKETALEQIAVLENEAKNPKNKTGLKIVKTAIAALKGITSGLLPQSTLLIKGCNELIPQITELFQHIHS